MTHDVLVLPAIGPSVAFASPSPGEPPQVQLCRIEGQEHVFAVVLCGCSTRYTTSPDVAQAIADKHRCASVASKYPCRTGPVAPSTP